MRATGVGAIALWLCAGAAAANPEPQRLNAEPGVPVPLAVESGVRADCSVGSTPGMRIVVAPIHGAIALREGRLRRNGSRCPAAPGYVVLYVADADFNGPDSVTLEVSDDGMANLLAFDILIEGKTSFPDAT